MFSYRLLLNSLRGLYFQNYYNPKLVGTQTRQIFKQYFPKARIHTRIRTEKVPLECRGRRGSYSIVQTLSLPNYALFSRRMCTHTKRFPAVTAGSTGLNFNYTAPV